MTETADTDDEKKPTANRSGRQANGRFAVGCKPGPGNPHVDSLARLRAEMLKTVTPKRLGSVIKKLVELAEGGDLKAIDMLLNRVLGKVPSAELIQIQDGRPANGQTSETQRKTMLEGVAVRLGMTSGDERLRQAGIVRETGGRAEQIAERIRQRQVDDNG